MLRGTYCIIMSGATERQIEIEARGLRFLAKPFRLSNLLIELARAAERNAGAACRDLMDAGSGRSQSSLRPSPATPNVSLVARATARTMGCSGARLGAS
jgi:hypothetical protein